MRAIVSVNMTEKKNDRDQKQVLFLSLSIQLCSKNTYCSDGRFMNAPNSVHLYLLTS